MKRLLIFSISALTLAWFGFVSMYAQQSNNKLRARFDALDANHDGTLSAEEVPAALFRQLDLNGDGKVGQLEALKAVKDGLSEAAADPTSEPAPALAKRLFQRFDADQSGYITPDEAAGAGWFQQLDRDQDQRVSLEETLAVADKIKASVLKGGVPTPPASPAAVPKVVHGPALVNPGQLGVGRQLDDITFTDTTGKKHQLSTLAAGGKGLVIAYTSTTCPVSKRYRLSLTRHADELRERGISLLLVNPFVSESTEAIQQDAAELKLPYVHDTEHRLTRHLNGRTTTEVFFIDSSRTLVYRGALDDQYGINYNLNAPRQRYLMDAVKAHAEGHLPLAAATEAPGCELEVKPASSAVVDAGATGPTYHREISRILQQNCVECHHEGGLAPFSLDDPEEVLDRAKTIQRVITEGTMPPWFATPPAHGKDSPWSNDRSLSPTDRADLLKWVSSPEKAMGDVKDAPLPLSFNADGWRHGQPDLVVGFAKPHPVKAEGKMPYAHITADTGLTEDRWLQGYQVMPGVKEAVHHVLVFLVDGKGGTQGQRDGFFAAFVPGAGTEMFPAGFAKKVPAGTRLRFQMHYTPFGKAVEDDTRIGLYFADSPPRYEVHISSIGNRRFEIPAGAPNHEVTAERAVPADVTLMSFMPHMHVRGKAFRYELVEPSGNKVLLDIPRYDFNWQLQYHLKQPLFLPRGSQLRAVAHYDNSPQNKANPDPTRPVRWGDQTDEEMMLGYIAYYEPLKK
jgi:mono/diheme cytochrome c family protein/peroxiredoxin